jgi:ethanolamine utilization protein EutN
MLIGRVIGQLVATRKHPSHEALKLLLVQPLHLDGSDRGDAIVAVDSADAGIGDRVLLTTEGFCAMSAVGRWPSNPIDAAILGLVDEIQLIPGVTP